MWVFAENLKETEDVHSYVDRELFRVMILSLYRILDGRITGEDVYQIGKNTGLTFTKNMKNKLEFYTTISFLAEISSKLGLGDVIIDKISNKREIAVVKVYDCVICSGVHRPGQNICHFSSGFFAGIVQGITGGYVISNEIECSANGSEHCKFILMRKTIF